MKEKNSLIYLEACIATSAKKIVHAPAHRIFLILNFYRKKREEKVKHIEEFIKIEPRLDVIARSRPEDKYLLVTALRELYNLSFKL